MFKVSENALMMSIQAIHQIAKRLSAERDASVGAEQANYDEMIEAYEIVAMELKTVYEKAHTEGADLPPYASLTS
ncbi:MAG: hypothetical protein HOP21_12815 [Methylotenera sp.]|nr:hypothetical protein [Methylotenera sp.]